MPPKRSTTIASTRPRAITERPTKEKTRDGLCEPKYTYEYANHVANMNLYAPWWLENTRPNTRLAHRQPKQSPGCLPQETFADSSEASATTFCKSYKFLDTPQAKQVLEMAGSLTVLYDEYDTAMTTVRSQLQENGNDIAGYALGNMLTDVKSEAAVMLGGRQKDRPLLIRDVSSDQTEGTTQVEQPLTAMTPHITTSVTGQAETSGADQQMTPTATEAAEQSQNSAVPPSCFINFFQN
ncbi:unnamed protein product [Penicillium palitans]